GRPDASRNRPARRRRSCSRAIGVGTGVDQLAVLDDGDQLAVRGPDGEVAPMLAAQRAGPGLCRGPRRNHADTLDTARDGENGSDVHGMLLLLLMVNGEMLGRPWPWVGRVMRPVARNCPTVPCRRLAV